MPSKAGGYASKTFLIVSLLLLLGFSAPALQGQISPKAAPVGPYTIPVDAVRQASPYNPRL